MEDAEFFPFALVPINVLRSLIFFGFSYELLTIVTPTVVVVLVWLDLSLVVAAFVSARMDTMAPIASLV